MLCAAGLTCALAASMAVAQTQFNWNPAHTGAQSWGVDGNWDQAGFPNSSVHVANLSGPLDSTLGVGLGANQITLAGLTLGGTSVPVSTTVHALGGSGLLVFQNDEAAFNGGIPLVASRGVAGSSNFVNAPVVLNEPLDFGASSTNDIRFTGTITAAGAAPSIRSFMPAGLTAKIDHLDITNPADPTNYRRFRLNDSAGSPAGMPNISTQGTLEFGEITGYGELVIGVTASQHPVPLGTVVLRGQNTFAGYVQVNRGNIVLANDSALGYGIFGGQPNQGVGVNFISDDDARMVDAPVELSQWFTIKGEHSLTWNNLVIQSNTRGWINLLPPGKTFTLTGGQYAVIDDDTERTYTFDGTGSTVVSGGLHDKYVIGQGPSLDGTGHFRKTGTGSLVVTGETSTYHGTTIVEAGTMRFNSGAQLGTTSAIVSTGGALGVDTGVFSDPAVLAKLDAADTGGIMLTPAEAANNLDFSAAPLSNAANVSVAAPESGLTYTGTITPAGSNYRLGGGTGSLTLPNQNQLTGGRGLVVTNGGEVRLTATNDYTGPTVISDNPFTSRTNQAIADTTNGIGQQLYASTTLTVSSLNSGGVASSIGTSSNDASNLVIQGSKLRIDGSTDKNQRLFTVGSRGATIETVGNARAFFVNTGPLAIEAGGAGTSRTLTLSAESAINGMSPLIQDAADGGIVGLIKDGVGGWELFGDNSYSGPTRIQQGTLNVNGNQTGAGETIVEVGGTLGGTGTVGGNVTAHGRVAPGRSVGELHIAGNLMLDETSELVIEISNVTPGKFDRLEVAGNAQLAGTLRVELPNQVGGPYVPKLGDVFPFLAVSGGAGGEFDQLDLPSLAPGLVWTINPGDVTVFLNVVAALEGDYNFNGTVDAADYTVWRDSLGQTGVGLAADGDHDLMVDDGDFAVWKSHFGETLAGAGQSLPEGGAVPEPSTLLLAGLGLASCCRLNWRGRRAS